MSRLSEAGWLEGGERAEVRPTQDIDARWWVVFAALANGRIHALDELYDLAAAEVYRLALWRTGSKEDAEDVVQDVFVRVAEASCTLASIKHPKRWLLTVTHRVAIDLCRKRKRRRAEPVEEVPYLVAQTADPERVADANAVSRLLNRLPAKQREVLLLRHFADCSYGEIGRITGVPTFTAASRHRLAVAKLRRLLEGHDDPSR